MSDKRLIIGVDEVGMGSIAGPLFVFALAVPRDLTEELHDAGVRDSKTLSAIRRDQLLSPIAELSLYGRGVYGSVNSINEYGQRRTWRSCIVESSVDVIDMMLRYGYRRSDIEVVIDGAFDPAVAKALHGLAARVRMVPKADVNYPAVSAASILAKEIRDKLMREKHVDHPVYDWFHNKGYPTEKHIRGLRKAGSCKEHRIKATEKVLKLGNKAKRAKKREKEQRKVRPNEDPLRLHGNARSSPKRARTGDAGGRAHKRHP